MNIIPKIFNVYKVKLINLCFLDLNLYIFWFFSKFKLILTIYDKILFIMRLFENEETGDDFFEKQLD